MFLYGGKSPEPHPTPNLQTTPCQLPATAYSISLQLPMMSGGLILYLQPEDVPCSGNRDPLQYIIVIPCILLVGNQTRQR